MQLSSHVSKISLIKTSILAACVALFVLMAPAKLHATTYTYDLVLTDTANPTYSGTGVATLNVTGPLQTYTDYYYTGGTTGLTDLSFDVDGQTYNLSDLSATNKAKVLIAFSQITPTATIWDITFADTVGTSPNRLELASTGGYIVYYNNLLSSTSGVFSSATLDTGTPGVTPEPSSLFLLGTGLLGGAGSLYRRFKAQRS